MVSKDLDAMLEKLRAICLALPEAVEIVDGFGHKTFKVNGKSFVIFGEGENGFNVSFKSDRESQELLLQKEHFFKTPYIGHHGWDPSKILLGNSGTNWPALFRKLICLRHQSVWLSSGWIRLRSEGITLKGEHPINRCSPFMIVKTYFNHATHAQLNSFCTLQENSL